MDAINSCNAAGSIPGYSDFAVAARAEQFPGLTITKQPKPDYSRWMGIIEDERGKINLRMTLQAENEFGGFIFYGKCELQLLLDFWEHLLMKFEQILVFADDLNLYDPESFLEKFSE